MPCAGSRAQPCTAHIPRGQEQSSLVSLMTFRASLLKYPCTGGYDGNFSPMAFTGCPHCRCGHHRQGDSHRLNEREQTTAHLSSESDQISSRYSTEKPKSQTERQDQKRTRRARTTTLHVCGKGETGWFQLSGWARGDFRWV